MEGNTKMRLDILIYAHDGRGLGHVSRSLAIGMALRRLYPELKILFISGCGFTAELLGRAPLDWLKLPAYKTEVVGGQSHGIPGDSMFSDTELGELRRRHIAHVVTTYNPRLVLVDHTPQGKHRELLQALEEAPDDCKWVLGVRGVVGAVKQATISVTREIFQKYYRGLLWYGDTRVLGKEHCRALTQQYGVAPYECGYVSRLGEYFLCNRQEGEKRLWAGVVSVPWIGEKTVHFLQCLAQALQDIPLQYGVWCLFIDTDGTTKKSFVASLFSDLQNCRLRQPGSSYSDVLMNAQTAVIYGGYNSLVDVLIAQVPALIILREMKDQEQQDHVHCLQQTRGDTFKSLSEDDITAEQLQTLLLHNLKRSGSTGCGVDVDGATRAARYLYSSLK